MKNTFKLKQITKGEPVGGKESGKFIEKKKEKDKPPGARDKNV